MHDTCCCYSTLLYYYHYYQYYPCLPVLGPCLCSPPLRTPSATATSSPLPSHLLDCSPAAPKGAQSTGNSFCWRLYRLRCIVSHSRPAPKAELIAALVRARAKVVALCRIGPIAFFLPRNPTSTAIECLHLYIHVHVRITSISISTTPSPSPSPGCRYYPAVHPPRAIPTVAFPQFFPPDKPIERSRVLSNLALVLQTSLQLHPLPPHLASTSTSHISHLPLRHTLSPLCISAARKQFPANSYLHREHPAAGWTATAHHQQRNQKRRSFIAFLHRRPPHRTHSPNPA